MDHKTEKTCEIALSLIKGVGPRVFRTLMNEYKLASVVFEQSDIDLKEHIGKEAIRKDILENTHQLRAEQEYQYCLDKGIEVLAFHDKRFPQRLNYFDNTPGLLYYRGVADLNALKIVSIVGTRDPSQEGKIVCNKIVEELTKHQCLIVSGLAYGIDVAAHKASVQHNLPTVGVMAHGHDNLYPETNKPLVKQFLPTGGLLSEYISGTKMLRELFPMRNRIVAAMCDAVIVVESAKKGGSLITAEFANEYNKDVFAVPGRPTDKKSQGCNLLIKSHKAHMYESVKDLEYIMRWNTKKEVVQGNLFATLSDEESAVIHFIRQHGNAHIDEISRQENINKAELPATILNLELKSLIKSIPGKRYICT